MDIIFMGTPDFAARSLEGLITKHNVNAVITQPDKPKGRGKKVQIPAVKAVALAHNIPVYQPDKLNDVSFMQKHHADIIVVVAYGKILPEYLLNLPQYGCVNVHASLLPAYRGAAPIQWALINGETKTGVTVMAMDKGLDTGDIILKKEMTVNNNDDSGILHEKLAMLGQDALLEALELIEQRKATREKQDATKASYASIITKDMGHIAWQKPAREIFNLIRGLSPWPSAYFFLGESFIKIWKAEVVKKEGLPGEVIEVLPSQGIVVACGQDALLITEVQAQGGRRMAVPDYLRGHSIKVKTILQ